MAQCELSDLSHFFASFNISTHLLLQFSPFKAQQVPLDAFENIELPGNLVNLALFRLNLGRVIKNYLLLHKRSFGLIKSVFNIYLFTLRYLKSIVDLS